MFLVNFQILYNSFLALAPIHLPLGLGLMLYQSRFLQVSGNNPCPTNLPTHYTFLLVPSPRVKAHDQPRANGTTSKGSLYMPKTKFMTKQPTQSVMTLPTMESRYYKSMILDVVEILKLGNISLSMDKLLALSNLVSPSISRIVNMHLVAMIDAIVVSSNQYPSLVINQSPMLSLIKMTIWFPTLSSTGYWHEHHE